jgi:hypothetical protein
VSRLWIGTTSENNVNTVFGKVPSGVPFKFPGDARLWVADADRYAHTLESDEDARSWRDLVLFEEPVELVGEVPLEAPRVEPVMGCLRVPRPGHQR